MSRTLSTHSTIGITLSTYGTANNPFTVAATGAITPTTGGGLYAKGGASYHWTIDNFGTITSTPTNTRAIYLGPGIVVGGGTVVNESGGRIASGGYGVVINGPGFVTNKAGGTIAASQFKGVYVFGVGTVINSGFITAGNVAIYESSGGTILNQSGGTITGQGGVWFNAPGTFTNFGVVIGTNQGFGAILFNDVSAPNRFVDEVSGTVSGYINAQIGGTDVIELASGATTGTLSGFGIKITNFDTLQFDTGSQWKVSGIEGSTLAEGFNSLAIQGFAFGDTIDFLSFAASSYTFASNALTLTSGASHATLQIQGTFSTSSFHIASDGNGGVNITDTTPCYLAGTRIRTDRGEIRVEDLRIGDCVITLDGTAKAIKWIGRRSYASAFAAGNRDVIPILIKQDALGPGVPMRDLYVSPLHALFFDDVLIQAEHLVNGVTILRCPEIDPIRYFHIELEQHDVIFAEGAPAETFIDCDSRGMFHNAREFAEMYPGETAPHWQFCAPRIETGPILEQVRRVIDARAGLASPHGGVLYGPLQGNLDGLDGANITGWAFDPLKPDSPVMLEVLDGDGLIARVAANRFRGDLETAGIGDGRHGFELRLARSLSPLTRHELRVRRVIDGRELPGSPLVIEAQSGPALLKDARKAIEIATQVAGDKETVDQLQATLLQGLDKVRQLQAVFRAQTATDDRLLHWEKGPRTRAKRALFIDDALPNRERDAGSNAVLSHIEALQTMGWRIDFVASRELARHDVEASFLADMGIICHRAPNVASVEEVLRRNRNMFDLVYLHRLSNAETYTTMVRSWQSKARVLYSVADLHHLRLARQASVQENDELLETSTRVKQRELIAMRMVDGVITHSTEEAAYLAREAPGAPVFVVPWAVTPQQRPVPTRKRSGIAFIGGYRHAPNPDAVRWLAGDIMPQVWQRDPDMRCLVVGPDWPEKITRAIDPRMQFLGQIERLDEVFDAVRLTVAPLRFGAGIKGKVLDSFAANVPCVMTSIAAEGLGLPPLLHDLVTDDSATFAELICDVHYRSGVNRTRAQAGLQLVRSAFSADTVRRLLSDAIGIAPAASAVSSAA